jgi:hypothetical protein
VSKAQALQLHLFAGKKTKTAPLRRNALEGSVKVQLSGIKAPLIRIVSVEIYVVYWPMGKSRSGPDVCASEKLSILQDMLVMPTSANSGSDFSNDAAKRRELRV